MTSNDAIAQEFIPYPYTFPAIKFEVADEVSNEEALAILEADVAIDDHLDTALELE